MESPLAKILRHSFALAVALFFQYPVRAAIETYLVPYLVSAVPRSWLPYATYQSLEGHLLALFLVIWPIAFLLPTAAFAEARLFPTPTARDLLHGALALGQFHAFLTAAVSFSLSRRPLDNLLASGYSVIAAVAYWIALRSIPAVIHRRLMESTSA